MLQPCQPTPAERIRRRRLLGIMRATAPVVGLIGRRAVAGQIARYGRAEALPCGLYMPLVWAERAVPIETRWCRPVGIDTIVADWVDCGGVVVRNTLDWYLAAGDWSGLLRSTAGDPVREEARQLLEASMNYRRTEVYARLAEAVARGGTVRRQGQTLTSIPAIDAYFERFVRVFRSIELHGVLPADRVARAGLRFNDDRGLGVALDEAGGLHRLQGGNHRWAIAQVLDIKAVPVELRLRQISLSAGAC